MSATIPDVQVFCDACQPMKVFWEGSLIEWGVELSYPKQPKWFAEARQHEKMNNCHFVMVKYPNRTVPLDLRRLNNDGCAEHIRDATARQKSHMMKLNPPSGNMYPWAYTTNPIGGRCEHECEYCYVNRLRAWGLKKYFGKSTLDERWFNTNLSIPEKDKVVFIQSCGDLFGNWISKAWIKRILDRLRQFPDTTFLLQSKQPDRFMLFDIPRNCILGTTIETNREYAATKAMNPYSRWLAMKAIPKTFKIMVSIEPVMDFDLPTLLVWMGVLRPDFISIGADSGDNHLPEPEPQKLKSLLWQLDLISEVRRKKNLERLLKDG